MRFRHYLETVALVFGLMCVLLYLATLIMIRRGYDVFFFEQNNTILYSEIGLLSVSVVGMLSAMHRKIMRFSARNEWEAVFA